MLLHNQEQDSMQSGQKDSPENISCVFSSLRCGVHYKIFLDSLQQLMDLSVNFDKRRNLSCIISPLLAQLGFNEERCSFKYFLYTCT